MRGSGVGETRRRHGFSNKPLQCLKGHQMLGAPAPNTSCLKLGVERTEMGGGCAAMAKRGC